MSDLGASLDAILAERQREERLPSVAAAVFRDAEVLWSAALGLADAEAGEKATVDTQYRIGSITKTVTAVSVLRLRDAGLVDLDDALAAHVPELPHPQPTLRRVLSHTGGLQREQPGDVWDTLEPPERAAFLASLAESEQVLAPGSWWHYSNLGFALLGEVVERVSGKPYRRYVDAEVLAPLGLSRTTWEPAPPAAVGYLVEPYTDVLRREHPVDLRASAAAGQLWSTVGDLARWGAFLLGGDAGVLDGATVAEMRSGQAIADPERWLLGWGLGLELYRRGDRIWFGHGGAMPGHLAALAVDPVVRTGAAVLTNAGARADPESLALALADRAVELLPGAAQTAWAPGAPPPAEVAGVLGRWWSEGEEFEFAWRGGRLEGRLVRAPAWRPPGVFARETDDVWRTVSGRERGELLRVVRDASGDVVRLFWATYPFTRTLEVFGPEKA